MSVHVVTQRDQIERLLQQRPVEYAYQLGYLDPSYAESCLWLGHRQDGDLDTIVLVYDGVSRPGVFTAGHAGGVKPLLRDLREHLPRWATGHFERDHRDPVLTAYETGPDLKLMSRMGLQRDDFRTDGSGAEAEVLSHTDTAAIMQIYAHWPDNFFEPYQLETGMYFGARADDGTLAAIAGIHNVSATYDVAAIGNLVTHPDHRGHGYAKLVTDRLLSEAFERVSLVTLDVQKGNEPAVRTYRHFGFEHYADFYEGELQLR